MGGIIGMIVIGFIVGLVARAILPGTQALGLILTALQVRPGGYAFRDVPSVMVDVMGRLLN